MIERLIKGDEKAFEQIFHLYYQRLLNFAKAYVINKEIAREIVQEAYLKLWETRSRLKPDTNPEAFLFTLVRNQSLNYLKHCLVEQKYSQIAQEQVEIYRLNYSVLKNDITEKFFFNEIKIKLDKAIKQLPPRCKKVFELSRVQELQNKEIATELNISIKTVENHITEALRRLRAAIKDYL